MNSEDIKGILSFLRHSEQLKNTIRTSHTSTGRAESVAEHTWRLCLMALILEQHVPDIDINRVIRMCIIHDLGEAINGDIPAPSQSGLKDKSTNERKDFLQLIGNLPDEVQKELIKLWDEYESAQTPEAKTAKAIDKLETIIQHNQGKNPNDFDYAFNLDYGTKYTSSHPIISSIRQLLDEETKKLDKKSTQ